MATGRAYALLQEGPYDYVVTHNGRVVAKVYSDGDEWYCAHRRGRFQSTRLTEVFDSGGPTIDGLLESHPYVSASTLRRKLAV